MRLFSSPRCPDRRWGSANLLFSGYRALFAAGRGGWFEAHNSFRIASNLRMGGSILKLPHTLSGRVEGQLCFYISNVSTLMLVPAEVKKCPSSLEASGVCDQKTFSVTKEICDSSSSSAKINSDFKHHHHRPHHHHHHQRR